MIRITLASQSRVRGDLLRAAGVAIDTASPGVDEDAVKERLSGSSPRHIAGVLADDSDRSWDDVVDPVLQAERPVPE